MKPKNPMTIKDIAKHAGVSVSTVSSILNGKENFNPATREKVWDSANKLNYTPNQNAKQLRAKAEDSKLHTNIIMHISHMGDETPLDDLNASWRSTLLGWEAKKKGLFVTTYWYYTEKGFACPPLINGYIDGAIAGTPHLNVIEILQKKIPVVLMDVPFIPGETDAPMVNVDIRKGFFEIMKKIKEAGHKKIGVCYSESLLEIRHYTAIIEAAAVCGIEIHQDFQEAISICPETHESVMKDFASFTQEYIENQEITALVCSSTVYAETLSGIFREKGIMIPDELSITGFGGYCNKYNSPTVTTMYYDWPEIIKMAIQVLNDVINGTRHIPDETFISPIFFDGSTIAGESPATNGGKAAVTLVGK